MTKPLPAPNQRIKQLVTEKTNGRVLPFASLLNEVTGGVHISQQKVDRLFHIDKKTNKFPSVPFDILEAILLKFPDVDARWLITGEKKKSGALDGQPDDLLTQLRKEIDILRLSLLRISDLVPSVEEENIGQEVTHVHSSEDKNQLTGKR